ncbi:unnamed protein product [Amoebophrya sp. A25]|nr:unnamed protein product [Amoebophrya sp. A25]|eukprot:GSA25T00023785001.1
MEREERDVEVNDNESSGSSSSMFHNTFTTSEENIQRVVASRRLLADEGSAQQQDEEDNERDSRGNTSASYKGFIADEKGGRGVKLDSMLRNCECREVYEGDPCPCTGRDLRQYGKMCHAWSDELVGKSVNENRKEFFIRKDGEAEAGRGITRGPDHVHQEDEGGRGITRPDHVPLHAKKAKGSSRETGQATTEVESPTASTTSSRSSSRSSPLAALLPQIVTPSPVADYFDSTVGNRSLTAMELVQLTNEAPAHKNHEQTISDMLRVDLFPEMIMDGPSFEPLPWGLEAYKRQMEDQSWLYLGTIGNLATAHELECMFALDPRKRKEC